MGIKWPLHVPILQDPVNYLRKLSVLGEVPFHDTNEEEEYFGQLDQKTIVCFARRFGSRVYLQPPFKDQ